MFAGTGAAGGSSCMGEGVRERGGKGDCLDDPGCMGVGVRRRATGEEVSLGGDVLLRSPSSEVSVEVSVDVSIEVSSGDVGGEVDMVGGALASLR